uniref:Glutaredoxin domain-containing protein n=1 Tax=Steinernema glaseri TaxID=37863 RepID=A0A1I7YEY9_9BILA
MFLLVALFCLGLVHAQHQYPSVYGSSGVDYSSASSAAAAQQYAQQYASSAAAGYQTYPSATDYGQQTQLLPQSSYSQYQQQQGQQQVQQQQQPYIYQPSYPSPYAPQQSTYPSQQPQAKPVAQNNVQRYAQYLDILQKSYGIQMPQKQVATVSPYTAPQVAQPQAAPAPQVVQQPTYQNTYGQQQVYPSYPSVAQQQVQPQNQVQPQTVRSPYTFPSPQPDVQSPYTYSKPAEVQSSYGYAKPQAPTYIYSKPTQQVQPTVVQQPHPQLIPQAPPAPQQPYVPQISVPQTYVPNVQVHQRPQPEPVQPYAPSQSSAESHSVSGFVSQGGYVENSQESQQPQYPYQQKTESPDFGSNSIVEPALPAPPKVERPAPVQPRPQPTGNSLSGEQALSVASATSVPALTQQIRRLPAVLYVDSRDPQAKKTEDLLRETYGLPLVAFYVDKIDDPKAVQKNLKHLTAHEGMPYLFICGTFIGSQQHIDNYHNNKQIPQLVEYVCGDEKKRKSQ